MNRTSAPIEPFTPTPPDASKVAELKRSINILDTASCLSFGSSVQKRLAELSSGMMSLAALSASSRAGELLSDLVRRAAALDVAELEPDGKFNSLVRCILGTFLNGENRFAARLEKASLRIDEIANELGLAREEIGRDLALTAALKAQNISTANELELHIIAAEQKIADTLGDAAAVKTSTSDIHAALASFERVLQELKLTRTITSLTIAQLQMLESTRQHLALKIQSAIVHTIPLWKLQMAAALATRRGDRALGALQKTQSELMEALTEARLQLDELRQRFNGNP